MRRVFALVFAAGCAPTLYSTITPSSAIEHPPQASAYEILGRASGEACESIVKLKLSSTVSGDRYRIAEAQLYEEAKLMALGTMPEADGLVYVRAKMAPKDSDATILCVALSGLAYKVTALAPAAPIAPTPPPQAKLPTPKPKPEVVVPKTLMNMGEAGPPLF